MKSTQASLLIVNATIKLSLCVFGCLFIFLFAAIETTHNPFPAGYHIELELVLIGTEMGVAIRCEINGYLSQFFFSAGMIKTLQIISCHSHVYNETVSTEY